MPKSAYCYDSDAATYYSEIRYAITPQRHTPCLLLLYILILLHYAAGMKILAIDETYAAISAIYVADIIDITMMPFTPAMPDDTIITSHCHSHTAF